MPVTAINYRPVSGPPMTAVRQAKAWPEYRRVMAIVATFGSFPLAMLRSSGRRYRQHRTCGASNK